MSFWLKTKLKRDVARGSLQHPTRVIANNLNVINNDNFAAAVTQDAALQLLTAQKTFSMRIRILDCLGKFGFSHETLGANFLARYFP